MRSVAAVPTAALAALLWVSCSLPPFFQPRHEQSSSLILHLPFEQVWDEVMETFRAQKWEIADIGIQDDTNRVVESSWIEVPSYHMDCITLSQIHSPIYQSRFDITVDEVEENCVVVAVRIRSRALHKGSSCDSAAEKLECHPVGYLDALIYDPLTDLYEE